ncbi:MAG TPA: metalloregulator ArsR/SmtB family transcription factor [Candidatus Hydrogenedentes bacterium]|nr:metalloregulator ArsR/SmtB family transcription factor [Candidatus Hydrogenedentota bacterium]HPO87653.1 metalloregulator ArsR/SmtB family transcription factor [Candidatus Hydrogenedentota bacterium]
MKNELLRRYSARAEILKALAHPTRLFLVDQLCQGERCVCELVELVGADFSTVSKHLAILKNAGFVTDEKRGLKVFYRLRCPCVADFFRCTDTVLRLNVEEQLASLSR